MVAPLVTIGTLTLATTALHFRDPHQHGSWGLCPLYASTGIYCPGCGGLRAVNDLTDGHVGAALSSNIMVTAAIPLAIVALLLWSARRWSGRGSETDWRRVERVSYAVVGLMLVFSVVRNLAFGAWLAP